MKAARGLLGFELRREMGSGTGRVEKRETGLHTFIINWGEGEDGRLGGGVTINDGWDGVPDFESTLRSYGEGKHRCVGEGQ